MNRANKLIFDLLIASNEKYREAVARICNDYKEKRDHAKSYASRYKDENAIFRDSLKTIIKEARNSLREARAELAETYRKQADKLEDSIQESLTHALHIGFVQRLDFYRNFRLKPTRSEIETLVTLAGNHLTALAGVNQVLEDNKSDYRLKFTTVESLEEDLVTLREFAMVIPYATNVEQIGILSEILGDNGKQTIAVPNQPNAMGYVKPGEQLVTETTERGIRVKRLVQGKLIEDGTVYDFYQLDAEENKFESMENKLHEMQIRWAGVTTPEIELASELHAKESDGEVENSTQIHPVGV